MNCPICQTSEWENVDRFRIKPHKMSMCKCCGFISYPDKYQTEEEIKKHYRESYRPPPTASHLWTGERKIWYHEHVLRPLIEEWKRAELKPVIGEIGSAMGMFVKWMSDQIDCDIQGTELTTSFRRVAYHEFGVELAEDLDWTKKYDMIASYHVLEHMLDPDKQLEKYVNALSDRGVLYLSVPVWFREAVNFGSHGFTIEYYWAPDHINCWAESHLEYLLSRAGLEPIFKNTDIYGNTYLLKKRTEPIEVPKPQDVEWERLKLVDICERQFKCWKYIQENETALAIEAYPNCPVAWAHHYEMQRAQFDKNHDELDKFLAMAVASCPHTSDAFTFAADIMCRYERYKDAYEFYERALDKKPNNPTILLGMGNCVRQTAIRETDPKKKADLFKKASNVTRRVRDTSLEKTAEATSFMYHDMALIPMAGE